MIELNLLPDVKLDYIKAQRYKRLVVTVSFIVATAAIAILVILLVVDFAQKHRSNDLNNSISSDSAVLQSKPNINKILTVQNQLGSLTSLHNNEPAASRLFSNYLNEITPSTVAISNLSIDFTTNSLTMTGTADSLTTINTYVDTLKFTTYTDNLDKSPVDAFSNVVLSSFGINSNSQDPTQAASYVIDLDYNPIIFNAIDSVTLSVPSLITTRADLSQPGDLFKTAPVSSTTSASGGSQ